MIIVFDLDDTLYDELTYVRSGFQAVAHFLSRELNVNEQEIFNWMWLRLQKHGRGSIFDDVLINYNRYSKKLVRKSLTVYRTHDPKITLPNDTVDCLERLSFSKYIVTDGNKIVQHKKVEALGLYKMMKHCYITHRYGKHNAKPSPYCFLQIAKREKVDLKEIVYIGDNPKKDFVGIKPLGVQTIRLMSGQYKDVIMSEKFEAKHQISTLNELESVLMKL